MKPKTIELVIYDVEDVEHIITISKYQAKNVIRDLAQSI